VSCPPRRLSNTHCHKMVNYPWVLWAKMWHGGMGEVGREVGKGVQGQVVGGCVVRQGAHREGGMSPSTPLDELPLERAARHAARRCFEAVDAPCRQRKRERAASRHATYLRARGARGGAAQRFAVVVMAQEVVPLRRCRIDYFAPRICARIVINVYSAPSPPLPFTIARPPPPESYRHQRRCLPTAFRKAGEVQRAPCPPAVTLTEGVNAAFVAPTPCPRRLSPSNAAPCALRPRLPRTERYVIILASCRVRVAALR